MSQTSSESSHNDDPVKDPDYVPSDKEKSKKNEDSTSSDEDDEYHEDDEYDEDDEDMESEDINDDDMENMPPFLMGRNGSKGLVQFPLMFIIQNALRSSKDGEEDGEEDDGYDDDEDDEHENGQCDCDDEEVHQVSEEDEEKKKERRYNRKLDKELRKVEKTLPGSKKRARSQSNTDLKKLMKQYNREERSYIEALTKEEKDRMVQAELRIRASHPDAGNPLPMRFKILNSPMDDGSKRIMLAKLEQFQKMHEGSSEYYKLRNWLNGVNRLPLGKFKALPINGNPNEPEEVAKVSEYLINIKSTLDETVFGHHEAKEQILRILAQWISNPTSTGHCIGIQGPPGAGKTSLVKDGICKALNLPFSLISLGCYGSDGSALTGHHITYEGSTYGKIAESLMKAQYMNPILYFDELDKISQTPKGEEVASVLIHLTDSTQNDHFSDNYFSEIPLDLSKCLVIFSYNDESLVNPILKDRMITIRVAGYTKKEKIEIARDYLIPRILATYNLKKEDIVFDQSIIEEIIERVPPEEGVRNMKRGIESIISWINMRRYIPNLTPAFSEKYRDIEKEKDKDADRDNTIKIELPVKITSHLVKKYLKNTESISRQVLASMYS